MTTSDLSSHLDRSDLLGAKVRRNIIMAPFLAIAVESLGVYANVIILARVCMETCFGITNSLYAFVKQSCAKYSHQVYDSRNDNVKHSDIACCLR